MQIRGEGQFPARVREKEGNKREVFHHVFCQGGEGIELS